MTARTFASALFAAALPALCSAQTTPRSDAQRLLVPKLPCCTCVPGVPPPAPSLDLSTGIAAWAVDGGPAFPTSAFAGWITLPPAQWVQTVSSATPVVVGAGPFNYSIKFTIPACKPPYTSVLLSGTYAADNAATVALDTTAGPVCPGPTCFKTGQSFSFSPATGTHALNVVVTNLSNISGLVVRAKLDGRCPVCPPVGACCAPKPGSTSDCSLPIMNLGHPQDVGNPLGPTYGKARCEAMNDGKGGCVWDATKPGCKVTTPAVSCALPPPATSYNTSSTSANSVPLFKCYLNTAGECLYNFAPPTTTVGGWNTGCPPAVAGSNCCGWK